MHRLSGEQVAAQFSLIHEGGYIRTTPTSSPRSSRSLGSYYIEGTSDPSTVSPFDSAPQAASILPFAGPDLNDESGSTPRPTNPFVNSKLRTNTTPPPLQQQEDDGTATPTPSTPFADLRKAASSPVENTRTNLTQPTPILKKSSSGESDPTSKSSTFISPPPEQNQRLKTGSAITSELEAPQQSSAPIEIETPPPRRYTSTRFSEEVAVSIPKASASTLSERYARKESTGSQGFGKKTPAVVASSGISRRRPAVILQRSSQSSHNKKSPSPPTSGFLKKGAGPTSVSGHSPASGSTNPQAPRPQPAKEQRRFSEESGLGKGKEIAQDAGGEVGQTRIEPPLVDPNFRSRFADRTRTQHRSFTNLSTLGRKSSAASATAASYQAAGLLDPGQSSSLTGIGQGRDAFHNEVVPLKSPAPSGPEPTEEELVAPLTRSKSQIALLLERCRAGSQE